MRINKIVLSVFLFLSMTCIAVAGQDEDSLKLGVVPFKNPRAVVELYTPVASILTRALGKTVRVVTASGYDQYLERIYAKQYDIIVLGSTFYFKAHDRAGYLAVARGYPPFYAGIIVRNDSNINEIEQLRGKSIAAVNNKDRAGYKMQKMALLKKGIDIDGDLDVHFRGNFDSVIYAVLSGQNDAGAIRLDALQKPSFSELRGGIKIIYTSSENPQFPFAVRPNMDPVMQEKIGAALVSISMEQPETAAILQSLNIKGIDRITSSDLELLRQARQEEAKMMGMQ